jgi:hypothetical protein
LSKAAYPVDPATEKNAKTLFAWKWWSRKKC